MILLGLCDLFWVLWLLPLLLSLLIWWWCNNRYNKMVEEYDAKIKGLDGTINGLEADLAACISKRNTLEGDLALTKGRMREMEADMKRGLGTLSGAASLMNGGTAAEAEAGDDNPSQSTNLESTVAAMDVPKAAKSKFGGIKSDNFQIIEGIGPKMESILKDNGISNFSTFAGKSTEAIQTILNKYGGSYKIIDPGTWVEQAKLAAAGDFNKLIDFQKKLDTGKTNAVGLTDSKLEKYLIKTGVLRAYKQDDLKAIEGIGPATDKLFRAKGINTWRNLADTSVDDLNAILKEAGSRFSLGDPTTWPKQAELAADGKFDELRSYQDILDGGKA